MDQLGHLIALRALDADVVKPWFKRDCTEFCVKPWGTTLLAMMFHRLEARAAQFRTVPCFSIRSHPIGSASQNSWHLAWISHNQQDVERTARSCQSSENGFFDWIKHRAAGPPAYCELSLGWLQPAPAGR
jgi:hypothetical protein